MLPHDADIPEYNPSELLADTEGTGSALFESGTSTDAFGSADGADFFNAIADGTINQAPEVPPPVEQELVQGY